LGGTLFLDEIGELPLAAQAKLLRVIEERRVTRIGAESAVDAVARVVAATHRDLEMEVGAGRFRQDLFYRLNVHTIRVPALRDRRSDVPELAAYFVAATCARFGVRAKTVAPDVIEALMAYDWRRNNVRELRNIVERMVIAADGDVITAACVPAEVSTTPGAAPTGGRTLRERKADAERAIVVAALERNGWHITNTAKDLGLADHASLLKIMRRHRLTQRS
jgi:DNA-binding NtrC family response regulator